MLSAARQKRCEPQEQSVSCLCVLAIDECELTRRQQLACLLLTDESIDFGYFERSPVPPQKCKSISGIADAVDKSINSSGSNNTRRTMDVCSQLQALIDQTGRDMYSSLQYLNTKHDYRAFDGQNKVVPTDKDQLKPDPREDFEQAKHKMAMEVVGNSKHFDELVMSLPGLDKSEDEQMSRISELQERLAHMEARHKAALAKRNEVHDELEQLITAAATTIRATR